MKDLTLQKKDSRKTIGLAGVLFILFITVMFYISQAIQTYRMPVVEYEKVNKGSLSEKISVEGEIKLYDTEEITAEEEFKITELLVKVRDKIKPGDLLLKFDTSETQINFLRKQLEIKKTALEIQKLKSGGEDSSVIMAKAELGKLQQALQKEQKNYENVKVLYEAGTEALSTLEDAKYRLDSAQADYDAKQKEIDIMQTGKDDTSEQLEEKNMELEILKLELKQIQAVKAMNGQLKSSETGSIQSVEIQKGSKTPPGQVLFKVQIEKDTPVVECWSDALEAEYLREGEKIAFSADMPAAVDGEGIILSKEFIPDKGKYKITCKMNKKDSMRIFDGQEVTVAYMNQKPTYGLVLSKNCISEEAEKKYVYILEQEEGRAGETVAKKVNVDVIDENDLKVVINASMENILTPETRVVSRSSEPLTDGMRVRETGGFSYESED